MSKYAALLLACGLAFGCAHNRPIKAARDYLVPACADNLEHVGVFRKQDKTFVDISSQKSARRVGKDEELFAKATQGEKEIHLFHCHNTDDPFAILPSPFTGQGSDLAAASYIVLREYITSIQEQRPPRPVEFYIIATLRNRAIRYDLNDNLHKRLYALAQECAGAKDKLSSQELSYLVMDMTIKDDKRYSFYRTLVGASLCPGVKNIKEIKNCPNLIPQYIIPEMNAAKVFTIVDEGPLYKNKNLNKKIDE